MLFYRSEETDPYFNLALEEYLLDRLPEGERIFLLWQNDNTIVVGKNQNTIQEINQDFVRKMGTKVARRITGGGAVYHDLGNLNFTFIERQEGEKKIDFSSYIAPILQALQCFGIQAEHSGRNDLLIEGRKFSGNAQTIRNHVVLHHGTLLFDSNLEFLKDALIVKEDKIKSKGITSVRSRVANIREYLEKDVSLDEFRETLEREILSKEDAGYLELRETDLECIQKLRDEKYALWEWNYGESPRYEIERYRRFPYGSVTIHMDVKKGGIIQNVKIRGDFFGNGDISELERQMIGAKLHRRQIVERLEQAGLEDYIAGVNVEEFADLFVSGE